MPVWITQLTLLPLPLTIYALLFLANVSAIMFKVRYVYRYYESEGSKDHALYRLRTISRYANGASVLVMWYTLVVFILPSTWRISFLTAICAALILPFIVASVLLIIDHFVLYDLIRRLRDTTETRSEGLTRKFREFIFTAIPEAIFWLPIIAVSGRAGGAAQLPNMTVLEFILFIIFGTIFYTPYLLLMSWIKSLFVPLALGAKRVSDNQVYVKLFAITRKAGLKKIKIYIWPGIKNKDANAMFSGLTNKKIFISDYLLEQLSDEEIEYVMGHEIGHCKKGHLWERLLLVFLNVAIIIAVFGAISILLPGISLAISFLIIMAVMVLYLQMVVNGISRIQERQADAYALQLCARHLAGISALYKLAELNQSPVNLNKVAEILQTHPSIANRIKWIMTENNISEEEFKLLDATLMDGAGTPFADVRDGLSGQI